MQGRRLDWRTSFTTVSAARLAQFVGACVLERGSNEVEFRDSAQPVCRVIQPAGERRGLAFRGCDVGAVDADGGGAEEVLLLGLFEVADLDECQPGRHSRFLGGHRDEADGIVLVWAVLGHQDFNDDHG
jgi:hypothetical protein